MTDIVKILEEIQVVCVDVQNQRITRMEFQKAVRILAGLEEKLLRVADAEVSAEGSHLAAEGNGRVLVGRHQDGGEHAGRRGLAVRAGNADGNGIGSGKLAEKLGTVHHRNAGPLGGGIFFVVRMNGSCIYN